MLVLIGGNGFIGRHVTVLAHCRSLPALVVGRAPDAAFLREHAPSATAMALADYDDAAGEAVLQQARAVIYLASASVPSSHVDQPAQELPENVEPAFQRFLRILRLRPHLPIVFLSSGGTVYGSNGSERIAESEPLRPISPYGLGKVLAEQCLRFCGDAAGQRFAVLRVSNPVGRWHRDPRQGLVMAVLRAIKSGMPVTIYGDGSAVRDYLDADDVAEAILAVAGAESPASGIWNVGSGIGRTVLEVVDLIGDVVGRRPEVRFLPARGVDVPRAVLDPTKMRRDFGWMARTELRRSIEKLLEAGLMETL